MATKKAERPQQAPLIVKLGIDPKGDTARWIQQQHEAGVKDIDILASLTSEGEVTPSPFKPRERVDD